jgi:hypothetical protein
VGDLRGRHDHRQDRRRHRPQARPGHRLRQDRRPHRRQGHDRHGLRRPLDHLRQPEWSVTLLRLSVLKRVVIAADQLGKLKTTVQVIGLGGLVLPFRDPDLPGWMHTPGDVLYWIAVVLTGVAVVLTVVSGAQFFQGVWRQRHALRGRPTA